jgi:alpha-glucosidase
MKLMGRLTNIRVDLKPYIKHLFHEATLLGYPVQRPLFMHYEEDLEAYHLQYQYLFGKDMLIKPVVLKDQNQTTVYLPKDEWVHLWTGNLYHGNELVTVDSKIGYPPVFYRKNSSFSYLFKEITNKYK